MATATAKDVHAALQAMADPEKAVFYPRFFKAGPGQYAEGDQFLGVAVPEQRLIAKRFKDLAFDEVEKLILSPWHEERLVGLLILVNRYDKGDEAVKRAVYKFYMANTANVNNWDLVDSSAAYIVGPWLDGRPEKLQTLQRLASSDLLWERRLAMLATFYYIRLGRADEALVIADDLLYDKHDLIQKAVGWMLREIGKRVDQNLLADFLNEHAATMPRTTLRYAIEHFTPERRAYYLTLRQSVK